MARLLCWLRISRGIVATARGVSEALIGTDDSLAPAWRRGSGTWWGIFKSLLQFLDQSGRFAY